MSTVTVRIILGTHIDPVAFAEQVRPLVAPATVVAEPDRRTVAITAETLSSPAQTTTECFETAVAEALRPAGIVVEPYGANTFPRFSLEVVISS